MIKDYPPSVCENCVRYQHDEHSVSIKHKCMSLQTVKLSCWAVVEVNEAGSAVACEYRVKKLQSAKTLDVMTPSYPALTHDVAACDEWLDLTLEVCAGATHDIGHRRLLVALGVLRDTLLKNAALEEKLTLKRATNNKKRKVTL